jgi:hypothetical protein
MQHRTRRPTDPSRSPDAGEDPQTPVAGRTGDVAPIGEVVRPWALQAVVAAYDGDTYRLLSDLADYLEASVAYVDRRTVEAHLERPLSDREWSAVAAEFTALAFDEHVGDAGTLRTDWIEDVLQRAGVPGRGVPAVPEAGAFGQSRPW